MTEVTAESIALSHQFFTRHDTYGPFDLTSDNRNIVGCIEPRDQISVPHGKYKTVQQTAGGGLGEGLDCALGLTVINGEVVPIEVGMDLDKEQRPLTVFGAHHDCTFAKFLTDVTGEMADPSDFTMRRVERLARYFNQKDHVKATLGYVSMAASEMTDLLGERENMEHLILHADSLYPEHANVVHVHDRPSTARIYVVNLHPNLGKNRNMKPRDPEEAVKIQGYHDGPAATIDNLWRTRKMNNVLLGLRMTSMILRSAAVPTVISSNKPEMIFLEVTPANTRSGLKITELDGPN